MQRAKGFSGKKKKQQLQAKRERKRQGLGGGAHDLWRDEKKRDEAKKAADSSQSPAAAGGGRAPKDPNRLRTVFDVETRDEIERRKAEGREPLNTHLRDEPWKISDDLLSPVVLPLPTRPPPVDGETKEEQEEKELKAFKEWRDQLREHPPERLNYFEQNIEVWRELWRTIEKSDVLLLLVDARYPLFHFPPALYDAVVKVAKKPMILVLNKKDLVAPEIVSMWQRWFEKNFPALRTVAVASFHASNDADDLITGHKRKLLLGKRRYESAEGLATLIDVIRSLEIKKEGVVVSIPPFNRPDVPSIVAASKNEKETKQKVEEEDDDDEEDDEEDEVDDGNEAEEEEQNEEEGDGLSESEESSVEDLTKEISSMSISAEKGKLGEVPHVIVGTIGHPNVGKSSLINGLMGKKVVSTSRTPGHTKHFQTIFLCPELLLMDCPGLVFPALDRPKSLQVMCGLFPLAQVREFYSSIRYLAERVPVEQVYALRLPKEMHQWSPWAIAEALAERRCYVLRGGRLDLHRAGREIITDCLDGRIVFSWPPPGCEAEMKEFLKKQEERRQAALLTPAAAQRENETEEEAEARRLAKREKKAEARRIKRLGPGHSADPRAVQRVLAQVAAAREEDEKEEDASKPAAKNAKEAERAREYAERQAAKHSRKKGQGPLDLK